MKKMALVCNLMYKPDSDGARRDLVGLLKYVQYRDDRDNHIPQQAGLDRWFERGLGHHHRAIARRLMTIAGDKRNKDDVLVRMMVVSPHPDLMAALPEHQRRRALAELTDTMMERYFENAGLTVPEYAFVIHDPATENDQQRLHAHVMFPATVPGVAGRQAYDLRRQQMPDFHTARDQAITDVMTRYLGEDRVAELDAHLMTESEKRAAQKARANDPDDQKIQSWFDMR